MFFFLGKGVLVIWLLVFAVKLYPNLPKQSTQLGCRQAASCTSWSLHCTANSGRIATPRKYGSKLHSLGSSSCQRFSFHGCSCLHLHPLVIPQQLSRCLRSLPIGLIVLMTGFVCCIAPPVVCHINPEACQSEYAATGKLGRAAERT